jgi:peptide/nickel transport system substrate-binding protein
MRRFSFLPAAAVALLLVSGCRADGDRAFDDVPDEERYGGTVVVGGFGDLQGMNPLVTSDNNSNQIQREMLFMSLVKYDEDMNVLPYLAERWDTVRVHPDTLELTFRIRQDVRWHDGTPTTGEDVLFTFQRLTDERTAFPNFQRFNHYSRDAELVDPYTVRMRLRAHADFLDIFVMTVVAPKHILGDVPPEQLLQHPFTNNPVGNGPFRFASRAPGQEWVFEANPDFPAALGGRPYADRIIYRYIPEMTTLMTELLTGRLDLYLGANPNQADAIRNASGVDLAVSPTRQYNYLAYNTALPIFSDPRTRRAITMAIDREQILNALVYGYGEVGVTVLPVTHFAFSRDAFIPYDPDGARQLLAEAGWRPGPDGVLRNAQGQQLRFTIITNAGNDVRRDIAEVIQAQLRPLGIVVQPRLVEWNSMIQQLQGSLNARGQRERQFEAVIGGWVNWEQKDDSGLLHSRNLDGPYQYVNYSNPRVDALIDTLNLIVDRNEARPLWEEYQHLLAQESPYTVLYYPERLNGIRTRLRGTTMDVRGDFNEARLWWIHPSDRGRGAVPQQPAQQPADTTP